jgi:CRP/FNR family transcriptional regulator, cyclic AMP receptor protein
MELEIEKEGPKGARPGAAPGRSPLYQPAVALQFFTSHGVAEDIAAGKEIFVENEGAANIFSAGSKMYLLLEGDVDLTVTKKPIGSVGKGEIFGEMASISHLPRSATAVARTACKVLALDENRFLTAIEKSPEFALMLMSIIISRLRETVSNLTSGGRLSEKDRWNRAAVFDRKLMADLEHQFEDKPPSMHPLNKVILKEGDKGVFMYLVMEGVVAISISEKIVEKIGPGGVFGEMALVDQSARVATATAESDCTLLSINRNDFMGLVRIKPAFALSLLKALSERLRFMTAKFR